METTLGLVTPFSFGRGWPQLTRLAGVAGNGEAKHVVPGNRIERLVAVHCQVTAGEGEGERFPQVVFADADNGVWWRSPSSAPVGKGKTGRISWGIAIPSWHELIGEAGLGPLPDVLLEGGMSVSVRVGNGLEADAVSNISMLIEEFPAGRDGYPVGRYEVPPAYNIT